MKNLSALVDRRLVFAWVAVLCAVALAAPCFAGSGPTLGVGANYWVALDDVDVDNVETSGLGYHLSLEWRVPGATGLGLEVERLPENWAGSEESVYAPQAYIMMGDTFYLAVGIGVYYTDGDFANDPFYTARVGVSLPLSGTVAIDIFGNYRVDKWEGIKTIGGVIDTDSVILGTALRFQL